MSLLDYDGSAPEEQEDYNDFSNPLNVLRAPSWINSAPEKRAGLIDRAMTAFLGKLETKKDKTIKFTRPDGQEVDAPVWGADGTLTKQGEEYVSKARGLFQTAAQDPDGGLYRDEYTGRIETSPWLDNVINGKPEKQVDPLADYDTVKKDFDAVQEDGKGWSWQAYADEKNKDLPEDSPARLDPDNKRMEAMFNQRKELSEMTLDDFGDEYIIERGGQRFVSPKKLKDIAGIENAIDNYKMPEAEKRLMKLALRKQVNSSLGFQAVKEAATAEADQAVWYKGGPLSPVTNALGGAAKDLVGMERQDLMSKLQRHLEAGGDTYSFIKDNAEAMDESQYGWFDKLTSTFWNANRATGAGAMVLASQFGTDGFKKTAAEYAADSQAHADNAFEGMGEIENYKVLGMNFSNKGMYDMAGQVASMFATFGGGALVKGGIKGLTAGTVAKVAAQSAGSAAGTVAGGFIGSEIGGVIGGDTGEQIGGLTGAVLGGGAGGFGVGALKGTGAATKLQGSLIASEKSIAKAGEKLAKLNPVHRTAIKMVADPSAYIGAMQAGGMSFGQVFNEQMASGADYQTAYNEAGMSGISNALSAFIATAVFNRIAPGIERGLTGFEGRIGDSLIMNIRTQMAGKAGREATIGVIKKLVEDPAMAKSLIKGIKASVNTAARQNGLKGYGPLADIASEFSEEFSDTALSDVFHAMLDDSETWTDTVWNNLGAKFSEYMAAGVMGAFGGAMGSGMHTMANVKALGPEARKAQQEAINSHLRATWGGVKGETATSDGRIVQNMTDFASGLKEVALKSGPQGSTVTKYADFAAFLANDQIPMKDKSDALAKGLVFDERMAASMESQAKTAEELAKQRQKAAGAPTSGASVLDQLYGSPPKTVTGEAQQWNEKAKVEYAPAIEMTHNGKKITLEPITVGKASHQGARVKVAGQPAQIVTSEQAAKLVEESAMGFNKGKAKRVLIEGFKTENQPQQFAKTVLPNEQTTEQSPRSNEAGSKKPADVKADTRDTGPPERNSDSAAPSDVSPESARRAKAPLSRERVAELVALGSQPLPGSDSPAARARSAAIAELKDNGLWDDAAKKPSAEAMALATAKPKAPLSGEVVASEGDDLFVTQEDINETRANILRESAGRELTQVEKSDLEAIDSKDIATIEGRFGVKVIKSPAVTDTAPPQTTQPDEKDKGKTDGQGQAEGQVLGAKPVHQNALGSQAVKDFRTQGNHIVITDDLIAGRLLADDAGFDPAKTLVIGTDKAANEADVAKAIREFGKKTTLSAEQDAGEPPVDSLFIDETAPKFFVRLDKLGEKDKYGGVWGLDNDGYFYTPASGKSLPIGLNTVVAIEGDDNAVLVLTDQQDGSYTFKKVDTSFIGQENSKGRGVGYMSAKWNANRLGEASKTIQPQLAKLFAGKLSNDEFDAMLKQVMAVVAPGMDIRAINFAPMENGEFFNVSRTKVETSKESTELAKEDRKLDPNGQPIIQNALGQHSEEGVLQFDESGDPVMTQIPHYVLNDESGSLIPVDEYVAPKAEATTEQAESTKTAINLDRANFMANLKKIFKGYRENQGEFYDGLVANEVARQVAFLVDEEGTHQVGLSVFGDDEMEDFFDSLNDHIENSGDKFIGAVFKDIAQRRLKGVEVKDYTQDQKVMVAAETMRALNQILTTGSWTESQTNDAKRLLFALNEDQSTKGAFKTVVEMLKRYMDKIRRYLHIRRAMGRLPSNLQSMLKRQETAYIQAGMRGDVDQIKTKALEEGVAQFKRSREQSIKNIGKVAMRHNEVLASIKRMAKESGIALEDLVEIDYRTGTIRLKPNEAPVYDSRTLRGNTPPERLTMASFIEQYAQGVTVEEINKTLADLTVNDAVGRVLQDVMLARQNVELARNTVINLLPLFDGGLEMPVSEGDEEGATTKDVEKARANEAMRAWAMILAASPNFDNGSAFIREKREKIEKLRKQDERELTERNHDILNAIRAIDDTTVGGRLKIMAAANELGLPTNDRSHTKFGIFQEAVSRAMSNSYGEDVNYYSESILGLDGVFNIDRPAFVSTRSQRDQIHEDILTFRLAKLTDKQLAAQNKLEEAGLGITIPSQERLDEAFRLQAPPAFTRGSPSVSESTMRERASIKSRRLRNEASKNMKFANEAYQNYLNYRKAVDAYNELAERAVREMLGETQVDKHRFGLSHRDLSYNLLRHQGVSDLGTAIKADVMRRGNLFPSPETDSLKPVWMRDVSNDRKAFHSKAYGFQYYDLEETIKLHDVPALIVSINEDKTNPDLTGAALTDEQFRVGVMPENSNPLYQRQILSSAAYRGGINAAMFLNLLDNPDITPVSTADGERYLNTFGYASNPLETSDTDGIPLWESIEQILPRFDGSLLFADHEASLAFDSDGDAKTSLFGLVERIEQWARKLQQSTNDGSEDSIMEGGSLEITSELYGMQTLAGRSAPAIFDRSREVFADDADGTLVKFRRLLKNTQRELYGTETAKKHPDKKAVNDALARLKNSKEWNNLLLSVRLTNEQTKIARQEARAFQDRMNNMEWEKVRTSRDAAFESDDLFEQSLNSLIDFPTLTNIKWYKDYYDKSGYYSLASTSATDLLEQAGRIGFSNQGEELFAQTAMGWRELPVFERSPSGEVVMEPVMGEDGKPIEIIYTDAAGNLRKRAMTQRKRVKDEAGEDVWEMVRVPVMLDDNEAIAYSIANRDNAGHAPQENLVGETDPTVQGAKVGRTSAESKQSREDRAKRSAGMERNNWNKWFTRTALLVGFNVGNGSADAAHGFLNNLARLENDGSGYDRAVRQGIKALFRIEDGPELDALIEEFEAGVYEMTEETFDEVLSEVVPLKFADELTARSKAGEPELTVDQKLAELAKWKRENNWHPRNGMDSRKVNVQRRSTRIVRKPADFGGDKSIFGKAGDVAVNFSRLGFGEVEHQVDPVGLLLEMVEMKARYERDIMDRARVRPKDAEGNSLSGSDSDVRATDTLKTILGQGTKTEASVEEFGAFAAAMNDARRGDVFDRSSQQTVEPEQADLIAKMLHHELLGKNKVNLFEGNALAAAGEFGLVSESNETLNLILQNIPGVMVYRPSNATLMKFGGDVGTLFLAPSGSSTRPVVFVGGRNNQAGNRALLASALAYAGSQPNGGDLVKLAVSEAAESLRAAIEPIRQIDSLIQRFGADSKAYQDFLNEYASVLEASNPEAVAAMERVTRHELVNLLDEHFRKMEGIGEVIAEMRGPDITGVSPAKTVIPEEVSMEGPMAGSFMEPIYSNLQKNGINSDIILLSEALTNPKLKRLLDNVLLGDNHIISASNLSDATLRKTYEAVQQLGQTDPNDQSMEEKFDADDALENATDEEVQESFEISTEEQDQDVRVEAVEAALRQQAEDAGENAVDETAGEISDEAAEELRNLSPSIKSVRDYFRRKAFDPRDYGPMDQKMAVVVSNYVRDGGLSPADAVLFNVLAQVVSVSKQAQPAVTAVENMAQVTPGRQLLEDNVVVPAKNMGPEAKNRLGNKPHHVGSWHTLLDGRLNGVTAQTLAFQRRRLSKFMGGFLDRTDYVHDRVAEQALFEVDEWEERKKKDGRSSYKRRVVNLDLNDTLYSQIRDMLPPGRLDDAEADVRSILEGMEQRRVDIQRKMEKAQAVSLDFAMRAAMTSIVSLDVYQFDGETRSMIERQIYRKTMAELDMINRNSYSTAERIVGDLLTEARMTSPSYRRAFDRIERAATALDALMADHRALASLEQQATGVEASAEAAMANFDIRDAVKELNSAIEGLSGHLNRDASAIYERIAKESAQSPRFKDQSLVRLNTVTDPNTFNSQRFINGMIGAFRPQRMTSSIGNGMVFGAMGGFSEEFFKIASARVDGSLHYGLPKQVGKRGKAKPADEAEAENLATAKREWRNNFRQIAGMIQSGQSEASILASIRDMLNPRFEAAENNPTAPGNNSFRLMLDEIAVPNDARVTLLRANGEAKSTEEFHHLRRAEDLIIRGQRELDKINSTDPKNPGFFAQVANQSAAPYVIAEHRYLSAPNERNSDGKRHSIPMVMRLIPQGALSMANESNEKEHMADYRAKWNSGEIENKYEFWIRTQAIARALGEYADKADDLHKRIKKSSVYFDNYDATAVAQQVTDTMAIQEMIAKARIDKMRADSEGVGLQLDPDAMALVADSKLDAFYGVSHVKELTAARSEASALSNTIVTLDSEIVGLTKTLASQEKKGQLTGAAKTRTELNNKNVERARAKIQLGKKQQRMTDISKLRRVKKYMVPENFRERRDLVAHLVENEGEWVLIGSISAEQDLAKRFTRVERFDENGKRMSPKRVLRELALSAVPEPDENEEPESRVEFSQEYREGAFEVTDFNTAEDGKWKLESNADGSPVTREQAAAQFAARHAQGLVDRANSRLREKRAKRGVQVDRLDDSERRIDTQALEVRDALGNFGFMVEQIILAHDKLSGSTKKKVFHFMDQLSKNEISLMEEGALAIGLVDLYAEVMARMEGETIINTLTSGLSNITPTDLVAMKYMHHHDAKVAYTYRKNYFAQQQMLKLFGYLDKGFDRNSGRSGYKRKTEDRKKDLAEAIKPLGNDAMEHTLGYIIASLRGVLQTRGGSSMRNLVMWANDFNSGVLDLKTLKTGQDTIASRKKLGSVHSYFTSEHVDLVRDLELVKEISDLINPHLKKLGAHQAGMDQEELAREVVDNLVKVLEARSSRPAEVMNYATTLEKMFKGITDAAEITMIAMGRKEAEISEGEDYVKWMHGKIRSEGTLISTVPLRYGYAAKPDEKKLQLAIERYKSDPVEEVSMDNLALLGGPGKTAKFRRGEHSTVLRPIHLNGLTGVSSMMDDALYRLNVTPAYTVLRSALGQYEVSSRNVASMTGSKFMNDMAVMSEDTPEYKAMVAALGGASKGIDDMVTNDMQFGVADTAFAETLHALSQIFVFRALFSFMQITQQTVPSMIGYMSKKAIAGNWRDGTRVMGLIGRDISAKMRPRVEGDGNFHDKAKKFVGAVAPWVFFRGADGMDPLINEHKNQVRYGVGVAKKWSGRASREVLALQEKGLELTIAKGERLLSRNMFLSELFAELQWMEKNGQIEKAPASIDDMLDWPEKNLPVSAIELATRKVNEQMGVSDQAKKAFPFQNLTKSPTLNALIRSISRFSNHTASTSSFASSMLPTLWSAERGADGKLTVGGQRAYDDALENVVGTVIQNALFHLTKIKVLLPIVLTGILASGDDDKEEAAKKAQKLSNEWLSAQDDDFFLTRFLKNIFFGKEQEFFRSEKSRDAAFASGFATLGANMLSEALPIAPVHGAALGFYPVSQTVKDVFTNPLVQEAAAKISGLKSASSPWESKAVYIYERDNGALQAAMQLTAPTAVAYDLGANALLSLQAAGTDDIGVVEVLSHAVQEIFSTREGRGKAEQVMKEAVWKENRNKR